jgi:hypothetical protein
LTYTDIAWMAGLLEGEGCFSGRRYRTPTRIQVCSTDKDVMDRAAELFGQKVNGPYRHGTNKKFYWMVVLTGNRSIGWMMTIYPYMGVRRKAKIREIVSAWRVHVQKRPGPKKFVPVAA